MSDTHHVWGPAFAYVSLGASSGTIVPFGVSVDGITIEFTHYVDGIQDDRAGPHVSTDEQRFGAEARISGDFVWYDGNILTQMRAWAQNGTLTTEGTMGYAGVLFGLGGFYYNLVITGPGGSMSASPTSEVLYNFPFARLLDVDREKDGTVKTIENLVWKASNFLGSLTSLNNSVLYKRTFP